MNYQTHFDPPLIEHLKQRDDELLQGVKELRLGRRVRKIRRTRGSSRPPSLIKQGRFRVGGVRQAQ